MLAAEIIERLTYRIGKNAAAAQPHDWLAATISSIRDHVIDRWIMATEKTYEEGAKRVYYLSLEFLIGRLMRDAVSNLGLLESMREALASLGVDLDLIEELEPDAALGNGGLGRLAACFMESLASLDLPACGYGIRYVNGMFRQHIKDGWQVEFPETWLAHGNPWEFERRETAYQVGFGGFVEGRAMVTTGVHWKPAERCSPTAYDTPVVGWRGKRVNTLRLWNAQPIDPIRLDAFNAGDHIGALRGEQHGRKAWCACSIPPIPRRPARSCGCARSISSPAPRSRTSCAAIFSISATSAPCPTRRRSSSTTPIRRWRSPN